MAESKPIPIRVTQEDDGGLTLATGDLRISVITRATGITYIEVYPYHGHEDVLVEALPVRGVTPATYAASAHVQVFGLSLVPRDPA